jgi:hypothetical protein
MARRIGSEGLNVQGTPYWNLRAAKKAAQELAKEQRTRIAVEDIATGKTLAVVGPNKFSTGRNPAIKLPSKFTPAEVRVNEQGKVQIRINPAKLGSGGRFVKCVESVEARGGARDPRAVCAAAGRKKYGKRNPSDYYWVEKLGPKRYIVDSKDGSGMSPEEYSTRREAERVIRRLEKQDAERRY